MNEIGRLSISTTTAVFIDSYQHNRSTGSFILIDTDTSQTVAAGMIIERSRLSPTFDDSTNVQQEPGEAILHTETPLVSRQEREARIGRKAVTIWMTGLSGSGKSTIAKAFERSLFDLGIPVTVLDGDNLRRGLNSGLGFSQADRSENLRRAAEVAALFNAAGISVICSFIAPYKADRERAREIIGPESFVEVLVSAPLEACEQRDPHGLYKKARSGELSNFTGISDPYEPPTDPALTLHTTIEAKESCAESLVKLFLTASELRPA